MHWKDRLGKVQAEPGVIKRSLFCKFCVEKEKKKNHATYSLFPPTAWGPLAFLPDTLSLVSQWTHLRVFRVYSYERICWVIGLLS